MTARSVRNFRNLKKAANAANRGDYRYQCASRAKRAVQISEEVADCRVIIGSIRCLKFNKIHQVTRGTSALSAPVC
ncbi:hypothetical protein ALC53_06248 [Atta colombica]|uniref:Uncharacterized protein n=1 Tax=Atta colombica TaxID=520822 RepID=A0A151I3E8_9HYME|nr:hypothetical protein ALC53_06248 [Atta colombica]